MLLAWGLLSACAGLRPHQPASAVASLPFSSVHTQVLSSDGRELVFSCILDGRVEEPLTFGFLIPPTGRVTAVLRDVRPLAAEDGLDESPDQSLDQDASAAKDAIAQGLDFSEKGFVRLWRVGVLTLKRQARLMDSHRRLELTIALEFAEPYTAPAALAAQARQVMARPWGFGAVLPALVENPADAERFAAQPPAAAGEPAWPSWLFTNRFEASAFWLKIPVERPGLYAIRAAMLRAAGLRPESFDLRHFRLFNAGREVPLIEWGVRGNRLAEPNRLLFAAEPSSSPHTPVNVYWLAWTPDEAGLRAAAPPALPAGAVIQPLESFVDEFRWEDETDLMIERGNFLAIEELRWVGPALNADSPVEHTFDLPGLKPDAPGWDNAEWEIRFYLPRGTEPTGQLLTLECNGFSTSFVLQSSQQRDGVRIQVPASALRERDNRLKITLKPGDDDSEKSAGGLHLDYISFFYPRRFEAVDGRLAVSLPGRIQTTGGSGAPEGGAPQASSLITFSGFEKFPVLMLDVSNPAAPLARLAFRAEETTMTIALGREARLLAMSVDAAESAAAQGGLVPSPASLRQLPACDYLIIAHADFLEPARALAAWHRDREGLRAEVVDVERLYDAFQFGMESPLAIRRFLSYLLETRGAGAPDYVLLFGDCTSDYLNYARNDIKNYVPSYSFNAGQGNHEVWASDYWFTTVAGDDALGDYILGRISTATREDADNVTAKTLHCLDEPDLDPWRLRLTYVADDGDFDDECELLRRAHTPRYMLANTIYLEREPWEDNYFLPIDIVEEKKAKVSTAGTARIIRAFNEGTSYVDFFGHGSPNIWCDERLWFGGDSPNSDNLHLTNFSRPAFVVNMTCNSGAIDYPIERWNVCIAEDMMRVKNGGAIGVFAPSGPGFSSAHQTLAVALRQAFFRQGLRRIGDATMRARLFYVLKEQSPDLARMFILLGDPALPLQIPQGRAEFEPAALALVPGDERRWTFTARPGFDEGRVWFFLMNGDGEVIEAREPRPFRRGLASVTFTLPDEPADGQWVVSGYFVDAAGHTDSAGGALIQRYHPWVTLDDWQMIGRPAAEEGTDDGGRTVAAIVHNQSPLPVSGVTVVFERLAAPGRWVQIERRTVSLRGEERRSVAAVLGGLAPGAHVVRARLLNYSDPGAPTRQPKDELRMGLVVAVPAGAAGEDSGWLALPSELAVFTPTSAAENQVTMMLECVVLNASAERRPVARLVLRYAGATVGQTGVVQLAPGLATPVRAAVSLSPDDWPEALEWTLESDSAAPAGGSDEAGVLARGAFPVPPLALPEVVLEEARLITPSPTEGETVFVEARLANHGLAAARDIAVKLFSKAPEDGGRELEDMTSGHGPVRVEYLAPGGQASVRLRWDPFKNLDQKQIVVQADPGRSVPEFRRDDNRAILPLRVRSKARLKGVGLYFLPPTEEERRERRIRLEAVVRNEGETPARGVVVAVYKSARHAPEELIEEALLPEIGPGETKSAVVTWPLSEEELERELNPSFQIYFKGSLQRTAGLTALESRRP
ncbi:MAG: hypothetical protein Kow0059_11810 [Candidatus Sumerlaeia bacterium]